MLEAGPLQGGDLAVRVCWWRRRLVHGTILFAPPKVNDFHDAKMHQPLIYPGKLVMSGTLLGVLAATIFLQSPGNRNLDVLGDWSAANFTWIQILSLISRCCIGLSWGEGGRFSDVLHFPPFSVLKSKWFRYLFLDFEWPGTLWCSSVTDLRECDRGKHHPEMQAYPAWEFFSPQIIPWLWVAFENKISSFHWKQLFSFLVYW